MPAPCSAAVALAERGIIHARIGLAAAIGFVVAAGLFAGDLALRQYAGHGLFPMAAPTGGTLLIASWLVLAVAAAWPSSFVPGMERRVRRAGLPDPSPASSRSLDSPLRGQTRTLRPARQSDRNRPDIRDSETAS